MVRSFRAATGAGLAAVAIVVVVLGPAAADAAAQDQRGSGELTLAAVGTSSNDFDDHAIGFRGGAGYFFADSLELSLRQTVSYVAVADSSSLDAATVVALDLNLPLGAEKRWVPYVGGNAGYVYGDSVGDQFVAAPEVGLKYFATPTTFIYAQVEYQTFFSGTGGGGSGDEQFVYTLGIGFRF
jgi:hypothetical protein